jgi:hypothetical protein
VFVPFFPNDYGFQYQRQSISMDIAALEVWTDSRGSNTQESHQSRMPDSSRVARTGHRVCWAGTGQDKFRTWPWLRFPHSCSWHNHVGTADEDTPWRNFSKFPSGSIVLANLGGNLREGNPRCEGNPAVGRSLQSASSASQSRGRGRALTFSSSSTAFLTRLGGRSLIACTRATCLICPDAWPCVL